MIAATYVLNLPSSVERWHSALALVDASRLPNPIRWSGVDGRTMNSERIAALQHQGSLARDLSRFDPASREGEIGCALGHASILREIVRAGWPAAVVLEDDAALAGDPADWNARFGRCLEALPGDWELFYLYRCLEVRHRQKPLGRHVVVPFAPLGAAAYAVTQAGARKLLDALTPLSDAVDRVYAKVVRARSIAAYAASPRLVLAGDHPSVVNASGSRRWVVRGVNSPPEYWPPRFYPYIGESRWKAWQVRFELAAAWLRQHGPGGATTP